MRFVQSSVDVISVACFSVQSCFQPSQVSGFTCIFAYMCGNPLLIGGIEFICVKAGAEAWRKMLKVRSSCKI